MKVIDLLNKIANKEEVPKEIYFNGFKWNYDIDNNLYRNGSSSLLSILGGYKGIILNDEIKILEESKEKKEIPEKLEYYDDSIAWVIDDVGQLSDIDKVIIDKLNNVIDYLKSKGDE